MSDPVTNVDVEDVLSSIRRLVSDTKSEDRQEIKAPEVTPETPSDVAQDVAKPVDALILTSALRVKTLAEDSAPEFRHADMTNFRHTLTEDTQSESENSTETVAHKANWSSLADDDYYEDDEQSDATPVIDFIRHSRRAEPEVVEFTDASKTLGPKLVDGTADEVEAEQGNPVDNWVEDAAKAADVPSDEIDGGDTVAEPEEAETMDVTGLEQEAGEHGADEENETNEEWQVGKDAETPEDASHNEYNEDDASLVDESVFASAAAASVLDEAGDQSESKIELTDFDESVIDEAVLRDLVAEIVRQELTGEMGERITRNVRKLVRREIHRAMLTREFE